MSFNSFCCYFYIYRQIKAFQAYVIKVLANAYYDADIASGK